MKVLRNTFSNSDKVQESLLSINNMTSCFHPQVKGWNAVFLSPGISQMCSWSCLDLVLSHILHWGKTSRRATGPQIHDFWWSFCFCVSCQPPPPHHVAGLKESSGSASADSVQLHSYCCHSMSGLVKLSSSSVTVRLPRYQNIQRIRLRKISKGPENTKKSQKLKGAKIPMKKRQRPMMSKITASDKKRLVHFFWSIAAPGETDRWMSSEGLTGVTASLSRKLLSYPLNHSVSARLAFLS